MIKIGDVVQMLGISKSTIGNWVSEYEGHFSREAVGKGNRRHRLFTEHDISILHTIATLRKQGQSFDDIRITLASGKTLLPDLSLPQLAKLRKRELTEGFIEEIISDMIQKGRCEHRWMICVRIWGRRSASWKMRNRGGLKRSGVQRRVYAHNGRDRLLNQWC